METFKMLLNRISVGQQFSLANCQRGARKYQVQLWMLLDVLEISIEPLESELTTIELLRITKLSSFNLDRHKELVTLLVSHLKFVCKQLRQANRRIRLNYQAPIDLHHSEELALQTLLSQVTIVAIYSLKYFYAFGMV